MNETTYKEYADLTKEIEILTARRDLIRESLLSDLKKSSLLKITNAIGSFTIVVKKTFSKTSYSKKLQKQLEDLELKKSDEQEKGIAKPTISEYIKFTPTCTTTS